MKLIHIIKKFTESHITIVLASLLFGVIFSDFFIDYSKYALLFLAIIFFLSSLKIDLKKVYEHMHDIPMLVTVNVFMLFLFPVIVYYAALFMYPDLAIAFLILAAMPAGMTAPLLAEISGGKQSLALVLTVSTSLLAPFTVPLVIKVLAGTVVEVSYMSMFTDLAKVIFIPFVIAQVIKRFAQSAIDRTAIVFKPISVIFLGLLIMVVVAKQADAIIQGFIGGGNSLIYLMAMFILFIIFHFAGFFLVFWRNNRDRVTITVCLTYMNFTLAIALADKYFVDPNIVIPVVFSVIPWAILLVPYKYLMHKLGFCDKSDTSVAVH